MPSRPLPDRNKCLNRSELNLQYCNIYSPVDGVVISRTVDVGQTIAASMQAPTLFTIADDLTRMQVNANVDEADVATKPPSDTYSMTLISLILSWHFHPP